MATNENIIAFLEGATYPLPARHIAAGINSTKKDVNKVLYKSKGTLYEIIDGTPPLWKIKTST